MTEARCLLCGELMPPGEEMFNYHGYSGPCPSPPLPKMIRRLYVAASVPRAEEARALAARLVEEGYVVQARWLAIKDIAYSTANEHDYGRRAQEDVEDLYSTDAIVVLTGDQLTRGGRHTEVGIMIARGRPVFLLGPREQVFHWHFLVSSSETIDILLDRLVQSNMSSA